MPASSPPRLSETGRFRRPSSAGAARANYTLNAYRAHSRTSGERIYVEGEQLGRAYPVRLALTEEHRSSGAHAEFLADRVAMRFHDCMYTYFSKSSRMRGFFEPQVRDTQ
jgi:hypothetical protein